VAEASDVVFTMVGFPEDVRGVYFGHDGLLAPAGAGAGRQPREQQLFIDMTTTEVLDLNMNAGDDTVTSNGAIAPFSLDVDGGPGLDDIDGGDGADTLDGGDDNDTIVPDDNPAGTRDIARGGNGDDVITWNGGDDDDINEFVEGDRHFYRVLSAAARNTFVADSIPRVFNLHLRLWFYISHKIGEWRSLALSHQEMTREVSDAVAHRDSTRARAAMEAYIGRRHQDIKDTL